MVLNDKNIELFDLIDKQFLQEFQDNFAKTTELACVTMNKNGFLTEPSNFTEFCLCTKGTTKGLKRCRKCDLERIELGFNNKEPFVFNCYAGLTNFIVPIVVNDKVIALMVGGQTFTQEPDKNLYKQLADNFGIDEKEYLNKVKKIKKISKEKIENATKLLSQIANNISNTAHQNYVMQDKNKKEETKGFQELSKVLLKANMT